MRHMVRIAVAVMVASLLAGVTLRADDDDDDRNERRTRRSQLVILNAMPDCEAGIITIAGENYGTGHVPHVTLNLVELDVISAYHNGVMAYLPPDLCETPGTYLLTVMRAEMKYRRRWLKLTNKDLGTFDVTIGAEGPAGADGADGATGPAGADGADGATGPAGADGADGATGPAGADGADGATGPAGPTGPAGADGADGATGPAGPTGPAGADGADGATGPAGADGADGATGPAGADGADGATGPAGADGADGADGAPGAPGAPGADGADGVSGYQVVSVTYPQGVPFPAPFANADSFDSDFPALRANCPNGKRVLGGAANFSPSFYSDPDALGPPLVISSQRPSGAGNAWIAKIFNPGSERRFIDITVYAICATVAAP